MCDFEKECSDFNIKCFCCRLRKKSYFQPDYAPYYPWWGNNPNWVYTPSITWGTSTSGGTMTCNLTTDQYNSYTDGNMNVTNNCDCSKKKSKFEEDKE
jgi:hypothetical protein